LYVRVPGQEFHASPQQSVELRGEGAVWLPPAAAWLPCPVYWGVHMLPGTRSHYPCLVGHLCDILSYDQRFVGFAHILYLKCIISKCVR